MNNATRRHGDDGGHCSAGARPGCFRGCAGCAQGARRGDLCRTHGLTPETRLRRTAPISGALAASYKSGGRGAHCRGSAGGERGAGGWCFFATKTWRRASGGVSTLARARTVRQLSVFRMAGGLAGSFQPRINNPDISCAYWRDWRRERDSNPRYGLPYTHFPGVRHRPLGHPSFGRTHH